MYAMNNLRCVRTVSWQLMREGFSATDVIQVGPTGKVLTVHVQVDTRLIFGYSRTVLMAAGKAAVSLHRVKLNLPPRLYFQRRRVRCHAGLLPWEHWINQDPPRQPHACGAAAAQVVIASQCRPLSPCIDLFDVHSAWSIISSRCA